MAAIRWKYSRSIIMFLLAGFVYDFSLAADAPVPQSGQTTSYGTRDDGTLQKGTSLPTPRFTDLGNGTVFDNLTSLIWMKNANCWGSLTWASALTKVIDFNNAQTTCSGYSGTNTDWRLPLLNELESLVDAGRFNLSLSSGHPFTGVQADLYWSSTTLAADTSNAWSVNFGSGDAADHPKSATYYIWPVRGGQ